MDDWANDWTVCHHKDGDRLIIYTYDRKAPWARRRFRLWMLLDTGHFLCEGVCDFFWKIPLGKRKWFNENDHSEGFENSLGGAFWEFFQNVHKKWAVHQDRCELMRIPIQDVDTIRLWPEIEFLYK